MEKGFETATVKFKMTPRGGSEQTLHVGMVEKVSVPEFLIMQTVHRGNVQILAVTGPAMERVGIDNEGKPIMEIRTREQEISRLKRIYGRNPFKATFPDAHPRLPTTFKAAGIHTSVPDNVSPIGSGRKQGKAAGKSGAQKIAGAVAEIDLEEGEDLEDFSPFVEVGEGEANDEGAGTV